MKRIMPIITIFFIGIILSSHSFSHGEDKPGPNRGFIRMPGAYHTELLPVGSNSFNIFLLDINWKNPVVEKSSVSAKIGKEKGKCIVENEHFRCSFSRKISTKKGILFLESIRDGQKGMEVKYELPLEIQGNHK